MVDFTSSPVGWQGWNAGAFAPAFDMGTTYGEPGGISGIPAPGAGADVGGGLLGGVSPVSAGIAGLQTLAGIWSAWQANKMAKKQFAFQKDITNTNLANQIKSYNTALADRARSRAFTEGAAPGYAEGYIAQNQLTRHPTKQPGY